MFSIRISGVCPMSRVMRVVEQFFAVLKKNLEYPEIFC
jgi:hypothetical protein